MIKVTTNRVKTVNLRKTLPLLTEKNTNKRKKKFPKGKKREKVTVRLSLRREKENQIKKKREIKESEREACGNGDTAFRFFPGSILFFFLFHP
ncbi:Uncharacterized protein TCM_014472 [Theobroma cacao]|uniref:Uncharacterized protein n=1 Tax=Theobroma cacao TaxID=3641 RepID=A0A061FYX4_THECC|nr:Uncharacterized protein TCM_014472 [Theobroma cacao]